VCVESGFFRLGRWPKVVSTLHARKVGILGLGYLGFGPGAPSLGGKRAIAWIQTPFVRCYAMGSADLMVHTLYILMGRALSKTLNVVLRVISSDAK
jgi:hypothetical protein